MCPIDYVNCVYENWNRLNDLTVLQIFSSHMLKTAKLHMQKLSLSQKQRAIAPKIISMLIHCDHIDKAQDVFEMLVKVFALGIIDEEQDKYIGKIHNFSPLLVQVEEDDTPDVVEDLNIEEEYSNTMKRNDSSFYK